MGVAYHQISCVLCWTSFVFGWQGSQKAVEGISTKINKLKTSTAVVGEMDV